MKVLESSPSRYDRGMKILTLGKIHSLYLKLTSEVKPDDEVLDLGCGTGLLSIMVAENGGNVKGIDTNPEMLAIANKRKLETSFTDRLYFEEKGVAELDAEETGYYDFVFAGLIFSELEDYEQTYTLKQVHRILKPNGKFILIDETWSNNPILRIFQFLIRFPIKILTYILTQTSTQAISDLDKKLKSSGFKIIEQKTLMLGSLTYLIVER